MGNDDWGPDWGGDWSDWDDNADEPVEVPIIGTPLDAIEKSIGIPHKYRVILNWIVLGVLVYLIISYFTKKKKLGGGQGGFPVEMYGAAGEEGGGGAAGGRRMKYDEGSQRWLVDVGDWCNPSLCVSDKMVNELCSYTCGTLGFGQQSAPRRNFSDPLSPLSMAPY